jgi:hypothetical protein
MHHTKTNNPRQKYLKEICTWKFRDGKIILNKNEFVKFGKTCQTIRDLSDTITVQEKFLQIGESNNFFNIQYQIYYFNNC